MVRRFACSCLVACVVSGAALAAERSLLSYVPADAWLVVHYDGTHPGVAETPLGKFFEEPEVRAALDQLRPLYKAMTDELAKEAGTDLAPVFTSLAGCEAVLGWMGLMQGLDTPAGLLAVNVGPADGPIRRQADELLKLLVDNARPGSVRQVQIGQLQATCLVEKDGEPDAFAFDGSVLVIADGEEWLRKALDPAAPRAAMPAGERAALRVRYGHQAMLKAFGAKLDPEAKRVLEAIGANAISTAELAFVPRDKRLVTSLRVEMPEAAKRPGVLKGLATAPAYDPALLKMVPRDATLFWLAPVDFPWLWDEVWATVARLDPQAAGEGRQELAAFEQRAGVKLRDGFLAPLGSGTLLISKTEGLWQGYNVLVQRVRDPQALEKAFVQLTARLDLLLVGMAPIGMVRCDLKAFQYRGYTCRYLWVAGLPAAMLPGWAPCYANLGDVFAFAPHPLHLKAYLDFLADKGPTILDNAEYRRLEALVPKRASSISYATWPDVLEGLYNTLAPIAMVAQVAPDIKPALDLANMPSSRTIRRYSRGSIAYTTFEDGVFRAEIQGEGLDILSPHMVPSVAVAIAAAALLPTMAEARTEARLIRDRNNLNQVARACAIYLNEHGDSRWYPKSLAELVDKKIIVDKGVLVSPLDDDPPKLANGVPCSYVSCFERHPNHRFQDDFPPNLIMAWDHKPFVEDRRNVLFFDSHVEEMDEEEFQEALKDLDAEVQKRLKAPPGKEPPPKAGPAKGEF
ncbi:MAG: hypothetical protein FJ291_07500 [Planctomycetes bacterium]|nr:hypothetical protein [Planctomycetota bacterium]